MKLKFNTQAYQTAAVQAVVDCFKGQPPATAEAISYRIDPGKAKKGVEDLFAESGFKNADLVLSDAALPVALVDSPRPLIERWASAMPAFSLVASDDSSMTPLPIVSLISWTS